jgi:ATP-binding cassette subfamily F protein uup
VALDGEGNAETVVGGWSDWAQARKARAEAAKDAARQARKPTSKNPNTQVAPKRAPAKLSYNDARMLAELPKTIETLNAAIARHESTLSDPSLYTKDPKRFASITTELENVRTDLAKAETRWLELAEKEAALG